MLAFPWPHALAAFYKLLHISLGHYCYLLGTFKGRQARQSEDVKPLLHPTTTTFLLPENHLEEFQPKFIDPRLVTTTVGSSKLRPKTDRRNPNWRITA